MDRAGTPCDVHCTFKTTQFTSQIGLVNMFCQLRETVNDEKAPKKYNGIGQWVRHTWDYAFTSKICLEAETITPSD